MLYAVRCASFCREGLTLGKDMPMTDDWQIVTTPTFDWLVQFASACRSRMLIGSPYVNSGVLELTSIVSKDVSRTLITRTDLRDFAVGASSVDSLCALASDGVTIKALSNLHAKMYILDNIALVTSANATVSGMHRNWECGLAAQDQRLADQLASTLLKGLGARRHPAEVTLEELEGIKSSVEGIKVVLPAIPFAIDAEYHSQDNTPVIEAQFSISDDTALIEGVKGWTRITLQGVLKMPEGQFHISDLLSVCGPIAAREYPRNQNIRPKLRQQLQILRDRGLVEFLGKGIYRRTMS